jgi:hypothetical protein
MRQDEAGYAGEPLCELLDLWRSRHIDRRSFSDFPIGWWGYFERLGSSGMSGAVRSMSLAA